MIKIKLIENWRQARKFWSVILGSIGAFIMGIFTIWPESVFAIWQSMPDEARGALPQTWVSGIALFLFVMSAFARIVKQAKLEAPDDATQKDY